MKQKYTSQDELILRIEELKKASFHMQKKRFVLYQLYQKEVDQCVENIKQLQQAKWKVSAWEKKEFIHFLLSTLVLLFGLYLYSVATIPALLFSSPPITAGISLISILLPCFNISTAVQLKNALLTSTCNICLCIYITTNIIKHMFVNVNILS